LQGSFLSFLVDSWGAASETFYRNVQQLSADHWLPVLDGKLASQRYWLPGKRKKYSLHSTQEVLEGFADLARQAARFWN
jgi:hypothetical protein